MPALRAPLAAACVVAAAAHVPVTGAHLQEAPYIGVLFIALEVVSALLAVAVLVRPVRAVGAAIAIVGALAVLALVLSRTIGLPLIGDDVGNWAEPLAVVSLVAESLMTVGGAVSCLSLGFPSRRAGRIAGVAILTIGLATTGLAAAAESAPAHDEMPGMNMSGMKM